MVRVSLRILPALLSVGLVLPTAVYAEDITALRAAVVKITSSEQGKPKGGTGFIVTSGMTWGTFYTAAHVAGPGLQPEVEFFTNPNVSVRATVLNKEGDEPTSLAMLMVQGKENLVMVTAPRYELEKGSACCTNTVTIRRNDRRR
jgi:hypothetical protein